jgi:hypothetical protein
VTDGVPLFRHLDRPGSILGHDRSADLVDSFHTVHDLFVDPSGVLGGDVGPFRELL